MRARGLPLALVSILFVLPAARAATREGQEREARRACLTGDVAKGVAVLTDLFIDTQDLTYIFNQGRCFEQNRKYEDAIGRFREYLFKGENLSAAERVDAEKHIAACQSYLGQAPQPSGPATAKPADRLPEAEAPTGALAPVAAVAQPVRTVDSGSGLRLAGLLTASAGVAALIGGVVLNLKVNSMSNDLQKLDHYSASTDSTRKTYKTIGWISYGTGAACVATGAVLYYLGWQSGRGATATIAPTLAPGMAGAAFAGAF
jgi:hypothetical protein